MNTYKPINFIKYGIQFVYFDKNLLFNLEDKTLLNTKYYTIWSRRVGKAEDYINQQKQNLNQEMQKKEEELKNKAKEAEKNQQFFQQQQVVKDTAPSVND